MDLQLPTTDVYLEFGQKRVFASALDWPGWSRGGRDEPAALQALVDYGPRYARAVRRARLGFEAPADVAKLAVVERLPGNASTDFGVPAVTASGDTRPLDEAELRRLQAVLQACWQAFDAAAQAAIGKELRRGPRGGGRDREGIIRHVLEGDGGYLGALGWKLKRGAADDLEAELARTRQAMLEGLAAAARGELPAQGPRGGRRMTPRYFVRRAAWHALDHAWEIEDRIL